MAKSANLYARIEPEVKEQAEAILSALGIPASNAITMFYKQVILQRGLPFEVKLPEHPLDISRMTAEQLDTELEKGYAQMKAGQTIPAKQAFDEFAGRTGRMSYEVTLTPGSKTRFAGNLPLHRSGASVGAKRQRPAGPLGRKHPQAGRDAGAVPGLRPGTMHSRNLRVMPVDNYLVFYIPDHQVKTVTVLRIMYGGRDIDAQLRKMQGN